MLALHLLLIAQGITVSVSHQPIEVLRTVTGVELRKVGLYEVISCNASTQARSVSEGLILRAMATKVTPISSIAAPGIVERSRRKTKRYVAIRTLEYIGFGVALYATKGKATALTNKLAFAGLAMTGVAGRVAESMKSQESAAAKVLALLADPNRNTEIPAGGCVQRMAFGEFIKSVRPYVVAIP